MDSINQLAAIFKEIHMMVLEQGTILDRIDYNIEQVVSHTESAREELVKGEKYQKSYGKKLWILLLIVVIIALILFLVARPKKQQEPTVVVPPANLTTDSYWIQ